MSNTTAAPRYARLPEDGELLSPEGQLLTDLMLMVFRVNGRLLGLGDNLTEELKINSTVWKLLGAVALAGRALSAPQIAEAMGMTRQGTQKQLNKMVQQDYFSVHPNPKHERSPLYQSTEKGNRVYAQIMQRHAVWANQLALGEDTAELRSELDWLQRFHAKLGGNE